MGQTSDNETEVVYIKSEIPEIEDKTDNDDSALNQNDDQCKNVENDNDGTDNDEDDNDIDDDISFFEKKNSNLKHKCTFDGCDRSFKKPSRLLWHLRQHTGERPYKCNFEKCNKSYTTSSHLKRHLLSHKSIHEAVVCGSCHLTLKSRENLVKHYRRVHGNKDRLSCDECKMNFRKKYKYDEHMAFHNGQWLKCKYCDREFKNMSKLSRHQKSHGTKYECPKANCNLIFDTFIELRKHSKDHPKEHQCNVCKKKFLHKNQWKRHLKTHEGKLIACPYEECNKSYCHSNQLNYHIRTKHEKSVLFECDLCKKTFTFKSVLSKHIQAVHVNKKLKVYKSGDERRERHDAGEAIRSMPSTLVGVLLPRKVEHIILNRKSSIEMSTENFESVDVKNFN
ncbi:zinc finger and BTB domain-containing protein 41-like isoform X2 [Microplitis mediator]|uniref:zinc finger and BTB domain-containing protein 41-like isoform X2 n=1 Tax=Microplitis mediator TaxID=375433 RepID=UPI0025578627|nr:zinc finger and BTB domain-containing protein 41-like isoform X2 [Microplitis mediator]